MENRCKDRGSGSRSLLNPRESLKFRRAFYRWWLFTYLFPPCYLRPTRATRGIDGSGVEDGGSANDDTDSDTDDDTDGDTDDDSDDDDGDAPDVYLARCHELRKGFLSEFSDDEVVQVWHVYNFMVYVSVRIRNATPEPTMHDRELHTCVYLILHSTDTRPPLDLMWNGPSTAAGLLRSLRFFEKPGTRSMEHFDWDETRPTEHLNWDYGRPDTTWPGYSEYLQERNYDISKVNTDAWDPIPGSRMILESRVDDSEECEPIRHSVLLGYS